MVTNEKKKHCRVNESHKADEHLLMLVLKSHILELLESTQQQQQS